MTTESMPRADPYDDICGQRAGILEFYRSSFTAHGTEAPATGWRDEATQLSRFRALTQVIDATGPVSINDLGCGYGGLFRFLVENREIELEQYFGYDIVPEVLVAAHSYIADPRAKLIESAGVTREADYSIACGTLFDKLGAGDEAWTGYIEATLRTLAEKSRRGFAFNLNSIDADWHEDTVYYGDPAHFFDFCRREFSRLVALRHDYSPFEWAILVRMEPPD